jgi:hypothetical protein
MAIKKVVMIMTKYIDLEAILHKVKWKSHWNGLRYEFHKFVYVDDIMNIPFEDVAPVIHGKWEPVVESVWNLTMPVLTGWRCSECGRIEQEKEPYCNCGAKMDR